MKTLETVMQDLVALYPDENMQISSDLMQIARFKWCGLNDRPDWDDPAKPYARSIQRHGIQAFIFVRDIVDTLGEIEHTGDWDPYLVIELFNGNKLETQSGYWALELKDDKIYIEAPSIQDLIDWDVREGKIGSHRMSQDTDEYMISIFQIKEITIGR